MMINCIYFETTCIVINITKTYAQIGIYKHLGYTNSTLSVLLCIKRHIIQIAKAKFMASGTISKRLTGVLVCRQLVKHTSASHTFPGSETSLRLLFYLF